jgi:hypothetical protein
MHRQPTFVVVALIAVVGIACAPNVTPQQYRVLTPVPSKTAYACALALVDSLGYTLKSSDRASGFLTSEKTFNKGRGWEVLTVATLNASSDKTELHVTAETDVDVMDLKSGILTRTPTTPDGTALEDAGIVITHCGGPNAVAENDSKAKS